MKNLLFLCTGNYYRSRFAEIVFNHRAEGLGLDWRAQSRGLNPSPYNVGPMSHDTIEALAARSIAHESHLRMPIVAVDGDFVAAQHVVAVKEAEHRPLMQRLFPTHLERVEFWHVHDMDVSLPTETIPHLEREIEGLIRRLASAAS